MWVAVVSQVLGSIITILKVCFDAVLKSFLLSTWDSCEYITCFVGEHPDHLASLLQLVLGDYGDDGRDISVI